MALLALFAQNTSVQGIVVRGANDPLSKAAVELRTDDNDASLVSSIMTGDDGRFVFQNVRPGRYRLTVQRQGYVRPARSITVAAGRQMPDIELPMTPAGAIYGIVYDNNGEPLGNVEVQALKASYPEGQRVLTTVQSVRTNDLGEYRLFWLAPGRYYVVAIHSKVRGIRQMLGLMMMAGPGRFFVGSSTNVDPAIPLSNPPFNQPEPAQSDRYVPVYFPGTIDEQNASTVSLRPGADTGGVNITITPVRARHVRGVIIDGSTGKPDRYGSLTLSSELDNLTRDQLAVDRDGASFDIPLLPGTQTITATAAGGTGYATVQVGDVDIENLTITTMPNINLPGRVVVEGDSRNGAALAQLHISLCAVRHRGPETGCLFSYSVPLPDGSITVDGSPGDYRVNVAPILNVTRPSPLRMPSGLQDAYVKSIRLGSIDVLNGGLHIERAPGMPLEIIVGTRPGAIEGAVLNDRQQAAGDITVALIPNVRVRTELYKSAATDLSGHFRFDRVPPGNYRIFAWSEVDNGDWYNPDFMRNYESQGTPILVEEGSKQEVQVPIL
jgi:hypothetical protein